MLIMSYKIGSLSNPKPRLVPYHYQPYDKETFLDFQHQLRKQTEKNDHQN